MSGFEITKSFKFDAAHRLVDGYQGKCASLHGHTWEVTICIRSMGSELDCHGMVFDFNDFAPLRAWIDNRLDHGSILNISDPLVDILTALPSITPMCKVFTMLDNPTSENLAKEIHYKAVELLDLKDTKAIVDHVIVSETCTSKAIYYG